MRETFLRETFFSTVVQGSTLEAIRTAATEAINEFFGEDLPYKIVIEPLVLRKDIAGHSRVVLYEAQIHCRGFEV